MPWDIAEIAYTASVWVLPVVLAVTLHEAAHGYVALLLGDPTAQVRGRVSLNPLRHVDPFGTIILPALLLLVRAPFLFGYARPVPVNPANLRNPRRDMMLVAAAGPAANLVMALAAALLLHLVAWLPSVAAGWSFDMLYSGVILNLVLAVFNLLPVPPLDGGRILSGLLPARLAARLAVLERAGIFLVLGVLFVIPFLAGQLGIEFNITRYVIWAPVDSLFTLIMVLAGHG